MTFQLHPQLERNCVALGHFPLCRLLLMNDANYPWFILVPALPDLRELYQLSDKDQQQLWRESNALSKSLVKIFSPDKLNIAALGNVVPQLHIHHIVRHTSDPAWPAPVWGKVPARSYSQDEIDRIARQVREALANDAFQPAA